MIVAMIAVRVMQPPADEVIDMVAVRHCLVSAVGAVRMRAARLRGAVHRIGGVDRDGVLVDVVLVHVMEMAVVEIVDVAVMANRGVTAVRAMPMAVVGVVLLGASGHGFLFLGCGPTGTIGYCFSAACFMALCTRRKDARPKAHRNVLRHAPPLDQLHVWRRAETVVTF